MRLKTKKILLFVFFFAIQSLPQNRIAVVLPAELKELGSSFVTNQIEDISLFEIFLIQNKIKYSIIFTDDLDNDLSETFSLLILPTSTKLNLEQFDFLNKALNNGTGIISFSEIIISDDDSLANFCEYLYGVKAIDFEKDRELNLIQSFIQYPKYICPFDNFELLIKSDHIKHLYRTDSNQVFPFGCINDRDIFTTSFFGFKPSGRFAHFAFTFTEILSDRINIERFENLLLKLFDWIQKNSGIWITNADDSKKKLIALIDLQSSQVSNGDLIKKFIDRNFPTVLVSDKPDKFKEFPIDSNATVNYGLIVNCDTLNTDNLISEIKSAKVKINFLITDGDCLSEDDYKRLSFQGIETILAKNSEKYYYNFVFNILSLGYSENNTKQCRNGKVIVAEYFRRINCDKSYADNYPLLPETELESFVPFIRTDFINEFLVSDLKINTLERTNELKIDIQNKNNIELKDILVLIDSKKLNDRIVYDISIDGKSISVMQNSLTGYYVIRLEKIAAKSKTEIKILFEKNS